MSEQTPPLDQSQQLAEIKQDYDQKYGFHVPDTGYAFKSQKGLSRDVVVAISEMKGEPQWMRDFRLRSLDIFYRKPMPTWGGDLSGIDFDDIYYYVRATDRQQRSWDEVPEDIKYTFDRLGIPEAEQKFLAGAGAQFESEVVYHSIRKDLEEKGVIFLDTDGALREHPELFREYWATVIPPTDNKFAALNSAVWSGGSFIYVPKGVHVEMPLQAYFRINTNNMGQFERTLIIVDEGASVHYVEGCLPPGEQVSLGDRWVTVEAVSPGDTVMNSDGCQAVVESVRARPFKGNLIEIKPLSAANTFRLTPEHPVLAIKREAVRVKRAARRANWKPEVNPDLLESTEPQFTPAGELQEGDFIVFPISKLTRPDPRLTVDVMRLLGYYLAEGSAYIHNKLKQPVVRFSFNESEREMIEEVKALIERVVGKPAMEVSQKNRHSTDVRVYSQLLMDLCLEHCGKGAATKQLSKAVMEQPTEKQAHLLETYFKGKGSVYLKRKHVMLRAATASQMLAWQLQELLARQGHYATINIRKGGKDSIQGREITRRDQYILYYSPDKQHSQVRRVRDYFLVPIKKITQHPYEGPVYNFELTHAPNAYVVKGFAVHNCTAPTYSSNSLHSAVVEIIVKKGGRARYTTIQNWSNNVYNLVTKRAVAHQDAVMEWVDANIGSLITSKYPSVYLIGERAHGEVLSVAFAGKGQHQDAGGKIVHVAPHTSSQIISKSISMHGGRSTYRGLLKVHKGAEGSKSNVVCDALLMDETSRTDTYPSIEIDEKDVTIGHEASVSKVNEEQLFYMMSRGIDEDTANAMIVSGFIEPIAKELPAEYSIELYRLVQLQMEGSVG
ncbi:MAG: Fe-S cluster assembly protein SufB [Chloroflexi bacterium CFX4]|nr:Fe-S cluster assembly protein SufB [Chloroflexi bacterium CFX4]MDL1923290.1 Fe-S cluster assembly protein SufB [Chloroflexi bacterium CFX3]